MKKSKEEIKLSDHFTTRRILRYCSPTMFMMLFTSIYGVVDGFFVSNFAGETSFAAINLIMPAYMILSGLGMIFGSGGTALIAKTFGEGDDKRANEYFSIIIEAATYVGIAVSILGFLFMPQITRLLGATDAMFGDAVLYGRILMGFVIVAQFQYMSGSFMNLAEKPKLGLAFTIAAGVTNMVLDFLLVGILNLGVAGAALATGMSQAVGGLLPMLYFVLPNSSQLRFKPCRVKLKPVIRSAYNGMSELMSNISGSVVSMAYNFQLLKYIGEEGVSAYGTIMYVQFIFVAIMFGYTLGASPIIGYHYGAANHKELNNLLHISFKIEYLGGVVMFLLAQACAYPVSYMYVGKYPALLEITVKAFRIFLLGYLLAGGNMFISSFFTALNNGTVSAIISFVRTLVFELAAVMVLPLILGADGIWYSAFVADIASAILSWGLLIGLNGRYGYFNSVGVKSTTE